MKNKTLMQNIKMSIYTFTCEMLSKCRTMEVFHNTQGENKKDLMGQVIKTRGPMKIKQIGKKFVCNF